MKKRFSVMLLAGMMACSSMGGEFGYKGAITPGSWLRDLSVPYSWEGKQGVAAVQIYFPRGYKPGARMRTLIALHGYRHTLRDWGNNTDIEGHADRYGFVIVCPDMSTTLYESRYYPETTNRWAPIPGGAFIADVLIQYLRKTFSLALKKDNTGIFGLSTGGRGALLLAAQHTGVFGAAAGLSGDYDPGSMIRDRLLTSVYGRYEENIKRWKEDDNTMALAVNLKNTPVFLAHGGKDTVVPNEQTVALVLVLRRLQKESGGYQLIYETKKSRDARHDWNYWRAMVPDFMKFFDESLDR